MFENLQERFGRVLNNLRGQGRLTEENVAATMREVRMALLEADVALPVVRTFVDRVREKAMGEQVMKSLTSTTSLCTSWAMPTRVWICRSLRRRSC